MMGLQSFERLLLTSITQLTDKERHPNTRTRTFASFLVGEQVFLALPLSLATSIVSDGFLSYTSI